MKNKSLLILIALTAGLIAGCAKNPAEGVAEATVEDPAAKPSAAKTTPSPAPAPAPAPPPKPAPAPAPASKPAAPAKYAFTDDSSIGFVGSKVTGSHKGGFKKFTGYFSVAGDNLHGTDHKVVIDMNSTWADHPKLEGHLKSADFFDVENHPESTFLLYKINKGEDGTYTLTGELTLRGATRTISFPAEITGDAAGFNLKAEFFIKRFDFDIVYPGKADDLIRDEVVIKLDLKAVPG